MTQRSWALAALVTAPVLVTSGCLGAVLLIPSPPPPADCSGSGVVGAAAAGVQVDLAGLPAGKVAGYGGVQLRNAALIINAAKALGLGLRAQTIGVMTAMGESALTVVDHGDAVGPDSRGLFQQRAVAWGSYIDRMNPTTSATNYFRALVTVPGWELLEPTIAAHRTQHNADPYYYTHFWAPAQQVVAALAGTTVTPATAGAAPASPAALPAVVTAAAACSSVAAAPAAAVTATGWTKPAVGPITSSFGMRVNPVTGVYRLHSGTDIGAPCRAPMYAAAAGRVVTAGPSPGYGNLVAIDHGGGIVTRYGHSYTGDVLVQVGATVTAGQVIARVGSFGNSTGCHLHFEVVVAGTFTDPAPFMASHGARLG